MGVVSYQETAPGSQTSPVYCARNHCWHVFNSYLANSYCPDSYHYSVCNVVYSAKGAGRINQGKPGQGFIQEFHLGGEAHGTCSHKATVGERVWEGMCPLLCRA